MRYLSDAASRSAAASLSTDSDAKRASTTMGTGGEAASQSNAIPYG